MPNNKMPIVLAIICFFMLSLSACGWTKKTLGLNREGPDETKVQTNEPLILPPEYSVRPKNVDLPSEDEEEWTDE